MPCFTRAGPPRGPAVQPAAWVKAGPAVPASRELLHLALLAAAGGLQDRARPQDHQARAGPPAEGRRPRHEAPAGVQGGPLPPLAALPSYTACSCPGRIAQQPARLDPADIWTKGELCFNRMLRRFTTWNNNVVHNNVAGLAVAQRALRRARHPTPALSRVEYWLMHCCHLPVGAGQGRGWL